MTNGAPSWQINKVTTLSDVATLKMPTNLRDFLSFKIIFPFRFGIFVVAKLGTWDSKFWAIL